MKKMLAIILLGLLPGLGYAASGHGPMFSAPVDMSDTESLQRGAKVFVNYCMGCHSASYMRFSRLGKDLGLSDEELQKNLMFMTDKVGSTMETALSKKDAATWFGTPVPDLSVISRSRGADWLYTYFLTFYRDPSRPTGVNNQLFKDVAMPHVLWELQGFQDLVEGEHGHSLELTVPGKQTADEYKATVGDLVNFLVYLGEPAQLVRKKVGTGVIIFLLFFLALAYALKKEYWKDVH